MTQPLRKAGWLREVLSNSDRTRTLVLGHGPSNDAQLQPMSIDDMMADVRRAHSAVASAQAEVAKREMGLEDARQMLVEAMEHHARLAAEATAAFEEGMLLR